MGTISTAPHRSGCHKLLLKLELKMGDWLESWRRRCIVVGCKHVLISLLRGQRQSRLVSSAKAGFTQNFEGVSARSLAQYPGSTGLLPRIFAALRESYWTPPRRSLLYWLPVHNFDNIGAFLVF